ncbi:Tapasin [Larimichthys crocea]|uniref:Tapasin n=1 Tax=Larimichthys crocea TaxID=215358 RepID=A0A6G0IBT9_LARCR|nr:Tapasin [Larimichthys crocea]
MGGMGGGSPFTRTPATLVLRDIAVGPDESLETLTPFVPPSIPDPDAILLEAKVIFLVFSHIKSVSAPLRGDALLKCGFKQQETPLAQEVGVEWRLQHRGKGRKVLEMKTRLDDAEGSTVVFAERTGSSIEATQVVGEGDASLTLNKLKILDEGTYICTVSIGHFHAQQVIQLHVIQPPEVSLSEEKLVLKANSPQTLSCHCAKYYPLDSQMEWSFLSPTDTEPTVFQDQGSLSSHRQHGDGTYSQSSHLTVPSSVSLELKSPARCPTWP